MTSRKVIAADIVDSHIRYMCEYKLACDLEEIKALGPLDPYVAAALNDTSLRLIERNLSM